MEWPLIQSRNRMKKYRSFLSTNSALAGYIISCTTPCISQRILWWMWRKHERKRERFLINGSTLHLRVDSIIIDSETEERNEIRIHPPRGSFLLFSSLSSTSFPLLQDACLCRHRSRRAHSHWVFTRGSLLACRRARDAYREATCGRTARTRLCARPYVRTYKDGSTQGSRAWAMAGSAP